MDTALSYITVLPSNREEVEVFRKLLTRELLTSDPALRKQLILLRSMFNDLLNDARLIEYWNDI